MKERRANSWSSKTNEEKLSINAKRRKNSHCGVYITGKIYDIDKLFFYAFKFQDGIKFGLTKHSNLYKRWRKKFVEEIVVFEEIEITLAISIEKRFKSMPECIRNKELKTTEFLTISNEIFVNLFEEFKCIN